MNNRMTVSAPLKASHTAKLAAVTLSVLAVMGATNVSAFELGHSRVTSAPGQPLVVQVPITDMSPQEAASLAVNVAPASAWQATGLKPPVPLDSFSLAVVPGRNERSRMVELRSNQAAQTSVVDVLLTVSTSASSRTVQTSIIVPPPPKVRVASDQVTVQRGDTLIGIAEQFPVSGANLYQQLWALYSSNPDAFLRENMNLLKAGAALRIPDADAVRAVDPVFAKAQYLDHVRAFRQGRGAGQGNAGIAADASAQTLQTPPEQQQGAVEEASSEAPPPASDQVRLTAAEQDAQAAQADAEAARAKAIAEEQERTQALEQNISALQGAIAENAQNGQSGTGTGLGTQSSEDAASDASASASGDGAGQQGASAADTEATQNAGQSTTASEQGAGSKASASVFDRASQWVSDNTTAAIALLLALIALILAWALRATKTKSTQVESAEKRGDHVATDFEQKLKEIDLSLDQKPEPTLSKPTDKA